jgi:hypothetical protein
MKPCNCAAKAAATAAADSTPEPGRVPAPGDTAAEASPGAGAPAGRRGLARRGLDLGGWLLPALLLVLMPKCPVCLAGYVAVLTGLSLSFPVAAGLRTVLLVLCGATLVFMAGWHLRRFAAWAKAGNAAAGPSPRPAHRVPAPAFRV